MRALYYSFLASCSYQTTECHAKT